MRSLSPQENPYADTQAVSKSGVAYQYVLERLHQLVPPEQLEQRNAVSRTDGYWPYIRAGQEPPLQCTYGEFDFFFFASLLDRAWIYYCGNSSSNNDNENSVSEAEQQAWKDQVFVDIGSGSGRLLLAAAALHPAWKACRGVELLPGLHTAAGKTLDQCRGSDGSMALPAIVNDKNMDNDAQTTEATTFALALKLKLAPIEVVCSSFEDEAVSYFWTDASCIFVTASCLPVELLQSLTRIVGNHCRPGTIVMSTDYPLPLTDNDTDYDGPVLLELIEKVDGYAWVTGGASTAYIHRVLGPS